MNTKTILAVLLIFSLGCGKEDSTPTGGFPISRQGPIEESIVKANCLTVQVAAEKFARLNDGMFPLDVDADPMGDGRTVTDLLPNGCLLENPYTLAATEPWNGEAGNQGETGYEPVKISGMCVGYEITGAGVEAGDLVSTLTDIDSPEGWVRRNCELLSQALFYFAAESNGEYPADINSDTSAAGMTAESYLYGYSLQNPYTGTTLHPVNGTAYLPGEIGYEPIYDGDAIHACKVTGVGASPGDIVAELRRTTLSEEGMVKEWCLVVIGAVDGFASENDERYPKDIDSDTNDRGKTLLDCIHGKFANPFTQFLTEPRNGRAHDPGEIGYEAIDGRGYVLTGAGKTPGDIIYEYRVMDSPADTTVKSNCAKLRKAVEAFTALNGGIAPKDVDRDTTLTGRTVRDLLPGGRIMLNPVTGRLSEPRNRTAAYPGEIGYAYYGSDEGSSYGITGIGDRGTYIIKKRIWTGAGNGKKTSFQR